jgi:hypothetical protein
VKKSVIDEVALSEDESLRYSLDAEPKDPNREVKCAISGIGRLERVSDTATLIARILVHDIKDPPTLKPSYDEIGTEALAWYQPFHYWDQDWGIFFDVDAMARFVAKKSFGDDPSLIMNVLHHERFHFIVEYLCAALSEGERGYRYPPCFIGNDVYQAFSAAKKPGTALYRVDEAMANAYALTRKYGTPSLMRQFTPKELRERLCNVCDSAPLGYNEYRKVCAGNLLNKQKRKGADAPSKDIFINSCAVLYASLREPSTIRFLNFAACPPRAGGRLLAKQMLPENPLLKNIPIYVVYPPNATGSGQLMHWQPMPRAIDVEADDTFQRSLKKIAKKNAWISKAWDEVVEKLANKTYNSRHFQKWPADGPQSWHIRVANNRRPAYRAHLKEQGKGEPWLAVEIGDHKEMGHG